MCGRREYEEDEGALTMAPVETEPQKDDRWPSRLTKLAVVLQMLCWSSRLSASRSLG
jgi:hypothetical protein